MKKIIDYFGGEKRFYIIMITLILMWGVMIGFYYLKADEVTKDPCSVCAKKIQEDVTCTIGSKGIVVERIYYPNFTIIDSIRK